MRCKILINAITSLDPVYSVNHAPYGELWNAQGTSPMPFGFTGEWQDPNDLLFLRARYYNPSHAAFLSLDPLEGGVGDVQAINRYAYVYGDPVNFVDPSGLVGETPNTWETCWQSSSSTRNRQPLCGPDAPLHPSTGPQFSSSEDFEIFRLAVEFSRDYESGVTPEDIANNPCATLPASVYNALGLIDNDSAISCQGTGSLQNALSGLTYSRLVYIPDNKRSRNANSADRAIGFTRLC